MRCRDAAPVLGGGGVHENGRPLWLEPGLRDRQQPVSDRATAPRRVEGRGDGMLARRLLLRGYQVHARRTVRRSRDLEERSWAGGQDRRSVVDSRGLELRRRGRPPARRAQRSPEPERRLGGRPVPRRRRHQPAHRHLLRSRRRRVRGRLQDPHRLRPDPRVWVATTGQSRARHLRRGRYQHDDRVEPDLRQCRPRDSALSRCTGHDDRSQRDRG